VKGLLLFIVTTLLVVVLGLIVVFFSGGENAGPVIPSDRAKAPPKHRSLFEAKSDFDAQSGKGPPDRGPAKQASTSSRTAKRSEPEPPPPGGNPALFGLEVTEGGPTQLRDLKVPEGMTGVLVKSVDPASSAAEASLRPGDVIVKAQRDKISSLESLETSVGNREHTLLTIVRDGHMYQVVLHKPFKREK
jgi:hypothetical protein